MGIGGLLGTAALGIGAAAALGPLVADGDGARKGPAPKAPPPSKAGKPRAGAYPTDPTGVQNAVKIDYVLAWVFDGQVIAAMPLPFHPSTFHIAEKFATNLERTFGETPKREHARPQEWDITLSGRIGTAHRYWYTLDSGVPQKDAIPMDIINKFQQFLDDYQKGAAAAGAMSISDEQYAFRNFLRHYLVLHAFVENKHFCVDVVQFDYDRTADNSRHSATWVLTLKAWRDYGENAGRTKALGHSFPISGHGKPYQASAEQQRQAGFNRNVATFNADSAAMVDQQIAKAIARGASDADKQALGWAIADKAKEPVAAISAAECLQSKQAAWVGGATRLAKVLKNTAAGASTLLAPAKQVKSQLNSVIAQYVQAVYAFTAVTQDLADLSRTPQQTLNSLLTTLGGVREAIDNVYEVQKSVTPSGWRDIFIPPLLDVAVMEVVTLLGQAGGKVEASAQNTFGVFSGALSNTSTPTTPYTLPAGVFSWKDVSVQLYGTSVQAPGLMALNAAQDAYSDSTGAPLYPGKVILVPATPEEGAQTTPGADGSIDVLLGTDFMVDDVTGDWVVDTDQYLAGAGGVLGLAGGGGTDVQLVSGYANLRQAVFTMATTPKKSIAVDPSFGLQLGEVGDVGPSVGQLALAPIVIRNDLLADDRIADVRNVSTNFHGDAWVTSFDVVPVGVDAQVLPVLAPILPQ